MGKISNLFNSVPGTKKDWKEDWKEDAKQDWKFDWDSAAGAVMPAPVNTVLPVISGDLIGAVTVGETLTTTNGTWTGEGISFTYQWRVDGISVSGATSSTFDTTGLAAPGDVITVRVTATNGGGTVTVTSAGLTLA
jgi:hypothetical protein